jgi:hypothetical protein
LATGENVHALGKHVLRVGIFGILAGLHKYHHEAAKELVRLETGETHEQKDTVQEWQGDQRESIQQEERRKNKKVDTQMSETSFLEANDLAVLALIGDSIHMHERVDGGSDKPRQSQYGVDGNHAGNDATVVVVSRAVGELMGRVVEQMPSDAVVKEDQDKGQKCWNGGEHGKPALAVQVGEVHDPATATKRLNIGTVLRV